MHIHTHHVCYTGCTHLKVSTVITKAYEDEADNEESGDLVSGTSTMEKKLDIIGAGSIISDTTILIGDDFYTNYIRCETDVQVHSYWLSSF